MILFVPYLTDRSVLYRPWATGGLIAANTFVFLAMIGEAFDPEPWILTFGEGLHPLQWVTAHFLHANLGHLLGNMFFLWVFGIVVEGEVGPWRFLLIYFGIGLVSAEILQVVYRHDPVGGALGASAVITGLMAMSLHWAPRASVQNILIGWIPPVSVRWWFFEVRLLYFCGFFILIDAWSLYRQGGGMSGELGHLMGAAVGLPVAILMRQAGWVDLGEADGQQASAPPAGASFGSVPLALVGLAIPIALALVLRFVGLRPGSGSDEEAPYQLVAMPLFPERPPVQVLEKVGTVYEVRLGEPTERLAGVIVYGGVFDMRLLFSPELVEEASGKLRDLKGFVQKGSPVYYLKRYRCHFFLFHDEHDPDVPIEFSLEFKRQLAERGIPVRFESAEIGASFDSMATEGIPRAIEWVKERPELRPAAPPNPEKGPGR